MEISWLGHSCFLIKAKEERIITDPYSPEIGLNLPTGLRADIVTVSHSHFDHNNATAISGQEVGVAPKILTGPGEYEINGAEIIGVPSFHDDKKGAERGQNTIFVFHLEGMGIAHLGDLGHTLTDEELEKTNQVDILLIPAGGSYFPQISPKKASEVINQIDPRIIIPMHYQVFKEKIATKPIDDFVKEVGMNPETLDTFKINKAELPEEERRLIVLNKK